MANLADQNMSDKRNFFQRNNGQLWYKGIGLSGKQRENEKKKNRETELKKIGRNQRKEEKENKS
jgi:hypothetical protein